MNRIEMNRIVRNVIENRKAQKREIEENIITPIKNCIDNGNRVILGEKSYQQFIYENEKLGEHLKKLFEVIYYLGKERTKRRLSKWIRK